jgi:predicted PurR-regulated permease PerM
MAGQKADAPSTRRAPAHQPFPDAVFVRRLFLTAVFIAVAAALWALSDLLLLVFAAVLIAIILRTVAVPIRQLARIPEPWNVIGAALLIALALVAAGWAFGAQFASQLQYLFDRTPVILERLTDEMRRWSGNGMLESGTIGSLISRALAWGTTVFGAAASLVLAVFGGLYIACAPETYRSGFVKMVPPQWHDRIEESLDDAHVALRQWVAAQLIAMVCVGVLTAAGMWLAGVPSPLALGLIAGLAEFVPYLGPIIGAIPAVLLASGQSTETVLAAIAVVIVVQQLENNVIMPLVAGQALSVPPATAIFAVVAIGALFGPLGLLLGFPLAVVVDVFIRRLYVREALGEPVEIAAEEARKGE